MEGIIGLVGSTKRRVGGIRHMFSMVERTGRVHTTDIMRIVVSLAILPHRFVHNISSGMTVIATTMDVMIPHRVAFVTGIDLPLLAQPKPTDYRPLLLLRRPVDCERLYEGNQSRLSNGIGELFELRRSPTQTRCRDEIFQ